MDFDNQPAVLRRQDDLADERSKALGGFHSVDFLCIAQRGVQGRPLIPRPEDIKRRARAASQVPGPLTVNVVIHRANFDRVGDIERGFANRGCAREKVARPL